MKIEKIYVEAKKSKNFQTYTVGLHIDLDSEEDKIAKVKEAQALVRKLVVEEMAKDVIQNKR